MSDTRRVEDRIEFSLKVRSAVFVLAGIGLCLVLCFGLGVAFGKQLATPSTVAPLSTKAQAPASSDELEFTFHRRLINDPQTPLAPPAPPKSKQKNAPPPSTPERKQERTAPAVAQRPASEPRAEHPLDTALPAVKAEDSRRATDDLAAGATSQGKTSQSQAAEMVQGEEKEALTLKRGSKEQGSKERLARGDSGQDLPRAASRIGESSTERAGKPAEHLEGSSKAAAAESSLNSRGDGTSGKSARKAAESSTPGTNQQGTTSAVERYSVQFAAAPNLDDATRLQDKLKASGIPAYVVEVDIPEKGRFYRVRAGSFSNRESARQLLNDARDAGFDGLVMH